MAKSFHPAAGLRDARRRVVQLAMVVTAAILVLFLGCLGSGSAQAPPPAGVAPDPIANPLSGFFSEFYGIHEVTNYHDPGAPMIEGYERFAWADLEPRKGVYDFSAIDAHLKQLRPHERFAFRILAINPCFSGRSGADIPAYLQPDAWWAPYLAGCKNPGGNSLVLMPNWESPEVMDAADRFLAALGRKYNGDPRIAYVDIGMFGSWGEWHADPWDGHYGEYPYCDSGLNAKKAGINWTAAKRRIIDAHVRAFPDTQLLMLTDDKDSLLYALAQPTRIPIGMRRDSWGSPIFADLLLRRSRFSGAAAPGGQCVSQDAPLAPAEQSLILNNWKHAPLVAEGISGEAMFSTASQDQIAACHVTALANGWGFSFAALPPARKSLLDAAGKRSGFKIVASRPILRKGAAEGLDAQISWRNLGVAPTYVGWRVQVSLWDPKRMQTVAQATSALDLRKLLPSQDYGPCSNHAAATPASNPDLVQSDHFVVPSTGGPYDVRIKVVDPNGYLAPMGLAQNGRLPDGSYSLGVAQP